MYRNEMEIAPKMSLKKQKCQLLGYRHVSTLIIDNDCQWDTLLQEPIFIHSFEQWKNIYRCE